MSNIILIFAKGIVGSSYPMTREKLIPPFPIYKDKVIERISNMKKLTTEEFVAKAKAIHGDKYGYNHVVYTKTNEEVEIYCPKHGYFRQVANAHLSGCGCKQCKAEKTRLRVNKGRDKFIEDARRIHGEKYNYDKVEYKTNKHNVIITCPIHGDFPQTPNTHLRGCGCPKCADKKTGERCRMPMKDFIKKANNKFDGYYDYSLVNEKTYKGGGVKTPIICPIHGVFYQTPRDHLSGRGCYKCGKINMANKQRYTREELVKMFNAEFDGQYDYSLFKEEDYKNRKSMIKVKCPLHGVWEVSMSNHLYRHSGCPRCKRSLGEKRIAKFLKKHNIKFEEQTCFKNESLLCKNIRLMVDFFIPSRNIVIEFNGAQHYKEIPFFNGRNLTEQQERDYALRLYCHNHNIKLIEIPYTRCEEIEEILKKNLKIN